LKQQLADYDDPSMSTAQRRFLMRELQRFDPGQAILAMLAAEDLAAAFVEAGQLEQEGEGKAAPRRASQPGLRATSLPGVWQFASIRGRVVLLHKGTDALLARVAGPAGLQNLPADVRIALLPPGREAEGVFVSLPAGSSLPDWRLALSLKDQKLFDAATDQRMASYIWIGVLVVAGVVILAMLILRMMRRQMALTRLKNDLVANVTHELKTPLSGMRLLVDTLLNSPTFHEPTVREYLALIARENLRLSRLIDNFLAFSRMERNKYALDFQDVPARTIVEGAAAAVQERFHAPGCRFEIQVAPDLPPIVADADAMVTAVVNLLDNAWKYSGDEKQITLTAATENGSVAFAVQDNGIGLSPRDTKRIFKRFYQVDQRLARSAGGCGLGLSIVKFIVTAHSGAIRVESEPGHGSTFVITIPVATAAHADCSSRREEALTNPPTSSGTPNNRS
jgi:signal transduction histidine kinase